MRISKIPLEIFTHITFRTNKLIIGNILLIAESFRIKIKPNGSFTHLQIRNLRKNGITTLHNFTTIDTVRILRQQIEQLLHSDNSEVHDDRFTNRIGSRYLGFPIVPISTLANIVPISESEIGSGGSWHRDANYPQFKALMYLNDVNSPDDGAFQYIPGSHRFSHVLKGLVALKHNVLTTRWTVDQVSNFYKQSPVSILGNAGTLVIFDTSLLHRGAPNNRPMGQPRYAITNYYRPKFTKIGIQQSYV